MSKFSKKLVCVKSLTSRRFNYILKDEDLRIIVMRSIPSRLKIDLFSRLRAEKSNLKNIKQFKYKLKKKKY
ncbi:hypothetical protein BpHYR1_001670 [Brachionus plicatilis]|uniref:Uncharacterized protein n=1 Tax=Brachionus plicatilis TaxID=10195 RepID=A0A3M7PAQ1_BRAPC|nr:hypothetical protein BpHYR1_001670 [Brachionus plicatilis]